MSTYSLSHLSDQTLLRDLAALVARDRAVTAALVAHLAEVDARKLYLPAAHPSMFSYCVHELGLPEEAAFKRIRAARTARQFPAIFAALADGRLHVSAVVMLAHHLTAENADELLAAAAHQSKAGIERLLAERFPRPDLPTWVGAISPSLPIGQLSPGTVESHVSRDYQLAPPVDGFAPGPDVFSAQLSPGTVATPPPRVAPLSPERFALQVTIGQSTHEKLRYAQALLGHVVPSGDVAQVLDRALDALIDRLEKRKFAATTRPRPRQRRSSANPRQVPADVRRAVWERDQARCTFVSQTGHRCPARTLLELDHIDPVARGGRATAGQMRLRCRAHNQYEAERTFGSGFMSHKREAARQAAAEARARRAAEARAQAAAAAERAKEKDVVPWLRSLGFRADEARRAVGLCEPIPDAPLEERVRVALSYFAKPSHGRTARILPAGT